MLLFLIRHAQTYSNASGKIQGKGDSKLTDVGHRQVRALARRLRSIQTHYPFSKVYSSPLSRAKVTAEAISRELDLELEVDELLSEMDHGSWDGMLLSDLEEKERERWKYWRGTPQMAQFPDGESLIQATERMRRFFQKLLDNHSLDDNIIVVSHAGIIKLGILLLLGLPLDKYWITGLENASLNILLLQYKRGRLISHIVKLNDTGHLDEEFGHPHLNVINYLKQSCKDLL